MKEDRIERAERMRLRRMQQKARKAGYIMNRGENRQAARIATAAFRRTVEKGILNARISIVGNDKEYHVTKGWRIGARYGKA